MLAETSEELPMRRTRIKNIITKVIKKNLFSNFILSHLYILKRRKIIYKYSRIVSLFITRGTISKHVLLDEVKWTNESLDIEVLKELERKAEYMH